MLVLQAGNVVTGEMVEELILSGADIIKVGIGPGEWVQRSLNTKLHGPQTQRPAVRHANTDET